MTPESIGFLVDTNVLSRRSDQRPGSTVERWIGLYASRIRISVVTLAEVRRGLVMARQRLDRTPDAAVRTREEAKLATKVAWYRTLRARFADRMEPIDADVAERWADVSVDFPSLRDGDKINLATAIVRGYGIATRNLRDFRSAGIELVDPFDPETWSASPSNPA